MTPQQIGIVLAIYAFVSVAAGTGAGYLSWKMFYGTIAIRNNSNIISKFSRNYFYDSADVSEPFVFGDQNVIFPFGWTTEQGDEWVAANLPKSP